MYLNVKHYIGLPLLETAWAGDDSPGVCCLFLDLERTRLRGWLHGEGAICFWLKNCKIFSWASASVFGSVKWVLKFGEKSVGFNRATCSICQLESWSSDGLRTLENTDGENVSRWRCSVKFASKGFLGLFFIGVLMDVKEGGGVIEGEFHCIGLAPMFSLLCSGV